MGHKRWWGDELDRLRFDYENHRIPMQKLAERYKTGLGTIARLAKSHGWPPRRVSAKDPRSRAMARRRVLLQRKIDGLQKEVTILDRKLKLIGVLSGGGRPDI